MNRNAYKEPLVDGSHAEQEAALFFRDFFEAKNSRDVERFLTFFSPDFTAFCDAALGSKRTGWDEVKAMYQQYMPNWGLGRSYPLRVLGGPKSAVVFLTNTRELFGGDLYILSSVDLDGGKVQRWTDYWDSAGFDDSKFDSLVRKGPDFASEFGAGRAAAHPELRAACEALHRGCTEGTGLDEVFTRDVIWEDLACKSQYIGRAAVTRMLRRSLHDLPFGPGAAIRHVVGGSNGGGYEWIGSASFKQISGIHAIELDDAGLIARVTAAYDSRRLS